MSQENDSLFNFSLSTFGFGSSPSNGAGKFRSHHLNSPALLNYINVQILDQALCLANPSL